MLREQWRQPQQVQHKGFRDWVTAADFASQALIVERILDAFPDHGFLPEEEAPELATSGDVIWIIDPVDGTSNFSRQQPNFCVSIAATRESQVLAGVIYDPVRDEMFAASLGNGATLNGEPMTVSNVDDPLAAIVAFDWGHSREKRQETLNILQRAGHEVHTFRAIGSAALTLAWLAAGRLDAYFNNNIKAWDLAAGLLLINEAGGRCTDLQRQPCSPLVPSGYCLASNGQLHDWTEALFLERQP
jgi:myo-inositol-1(or 4)-monophosphatase